MLRYQYSPSSWPGSAQSTVTVEKNGTVPGIGVTPARSATTSSRSSSMCAECEA